MLFSGIYSSTVAMEPSLVMADHSILMTALENIPGYYGKLEFSIETSDQRNIFLQKFKGTWQRESVGTLKYAFDLHMKRAGIDDAWFEELYKTDKDIQKNTSLITVKAFMPFIIHRFNNPPSIQNPPTRKVS